MGLDLATPDHATQSRRDAATPRLRPTSSCSSTTLRHTRRQWLHHPQSCDRPKRAFRAGSRPLLGPRSLDAEILPTGQTPPASTPAAEPPSSSPRDPPQVDPLLPCLEPILEPPPFATSRENLQAEPAPVAEFSRFGPGLGVLNRQVGERHGGNFQQVTCSCPHCCPRM